MPGYKVGKKILIFEYITGGGFAQQDLPGSLAKEGVMMLNALVNELAVCPDVQLTIVLDWRVNDLIVPKNVTIVRVTRNQCVYKLLSGLITQFDFIWPVAPEIDAALYKVTKLIEQQKISLLSSSSQAVYLCSDKLATAQLLNQWDVLTVESVQLDLFSNQFAGPWVIKPKEGAGCFNSYYVDHNNYSEIIKQIESQADYIIQPYMIGKTLSLSCVFRAGKAWLLCCNQQQVSIKNAQFELEACIVNVDTENLNDYQKLIDQIAMAIPGLFAYVGIDIIHSENLPPLVLEINPRLTTSYVGINPATGVNVAKAVIEMSEIAPIINKTRNRQYKVSINE